MSEVLEALKRETSYSMQDRRVELSTVADGYVYVGFIGRVESAGVWLHRDDSKIQFYPWTSVRSITLL
jgi:hypothetical protein